MRIEKKEKKEKKEEIIEIQEDIRIHTEDEEDVILEKGDKIKVLERSDYLVYYIPPGSAAGEEVKFKKWIEKNRPEIDEVIIEDNPYTLWVNGEPVDDEEEYFGHKSLWELYNDDVY